MHNPLVATSHRRQDPRFLLRTPYSPLRPSRLDTKLAMALIGLAMTSALALSLSVCGPASAQPASATTSNGTTVAVAATKTSLLRSAFTMSFRHSSPTTGSSTPTGAHGLVDFSAPSGTITLALPGGTSGQEQMVFLPGTVFVKPPSSSPPLQHGRPWIFANFADIAKFNVMFPPYIVQTESVNPALALSTLAWGTTKASSYGLVQFNGVRTHHYRARVNLNQALTHATGPAAAVFAQAITSQITASGGNTFTSVVTIPMDVWVDGSGRLIGIRWTPPGAGIGTVAIALHGFGSSVHAAKPPRAKVVDIAAMIPGGEQEALNGGDSDGA
jgi:hypothetical protein